MRHHSWRHAQNSPHGFLTVTLASAKNRSRRSYHAARSSSLMNISNMLEARSVSITSRRKSYTALAANWSETVAPVRTSASGALLVCHSDLARGQTLQLTRKDTHSKQPSAILLKRPPDFKAGVVTRTRTSGIAECRVSVAGASCRSQHGTSVTLLMLLAKTAPAPPLLGSYG